MTKQIYPSKDKIVVILEKATDGYWASVEALPGCYSFGETIDAALNNVREAIEDHISDLKETGMEVPKVFLKPYDIQVRYDLQTLFEAFHFINKSAFAEYAGINPSLLRQYTKGIAFASEKQKSKIKNALCEISQSLENACL